MEEFPATRSWLNDANAFLREKLPTSNGTGIIVGPSHSVRWRHAIAHSVLPAPFQNTIIIGEGGFPVWNRTIFQKLFRAHKVGTPIFLIAPDHRFGNNLLNSNSFVPGQFYDGFTHIEKGLIQASNDAIMYRQQVENLAIWRSVFGRDLSIFNWTLLLTASHHKAEGRYHSDDGVYLNSAYTEWVKFDRLRLSALSWPEQLLSTANARLCRLTVDRSLHPSGVGYFMLHFMVAGDPIMTALEKAEGLWSYWINSLARAVSKITDKIGPVVISGNAQCFETAKRLFGADDLSRLSAAGLFIGSDTIETERSDCVHISISRGTELAFGSGSRERPYIIHWDMFARPQVAKRHKDNANLAIPGIEALSKGKRASSFEERWLASALGAQDPEIYIDAGGDLSPTFAGVAMVLLSAVENLTQAGA